MTAAGDIAGSGDPQHHEFVNALRTGDVVRSVAPTYALTLGDNAYDGSPADFATMYDPTWGSFKAITKPSPGNHEYYGDDAVGYFGYFFGGQRAGNEYYATTCGSWRLYSLNCEIACETGSAQLAWLQQDLAAHPGLHYLGYLHQPRFSSGSGHGSNSDVSAVWAALQQAGGDVMLSAHDHNYERFAKQNANGVADPNGMRQFVVGTGGAGITGFGSPEPGSEVRDATHFGVLKLVLGDESYRWEFLSAGRHVAGGDDVDDPDHPLGTVLDSGTTATNNTLGGNRTPVVDAGADRSVVLPGSVSLDGSVADDGLPSGSVVSQSWSVDSGPGSVTFGDATAVDTTASFEVAGTYVLRLTATDGALTAFDTVSVSVSAGGGGGTGTVLERRISAAGDDAEQSLSGSMDLGSSDLELVTDGRRVQVTATRFTNVTVPEGATITGAWVQFTTHQVTSTATSLTVRAEAADNPPTYAKTRSDITNRATTATGVPWAPAAWTTVGAAGAAQRTPDLSSLVQAVVDRTGWTSGNAMAFQFSGTGVRTAVSYDTDAAAAPQLHIEYTTP